MSPLRLNGSTSGNVTLDAPAVSGNNTLVLPTGNGSSGQFLQTNGSGALSFASAVVNGSSSAIVSGTAVASTSGTSIDFTGIPSWVKRVTVMFDGVSTNGTSSFLIQLGDSGGVSSAGYNCSSLYSSSGVANAVSTAGFLISTAAQTTTVYGQMIINLLNASSNAWIESGNFSAPASTLSFYTSGSKTLTSTLTRVRITTVNGTDTFDAGSINLLWE